MVSSFEERHIIGCRRNKKMPLQHPTGTARPTMTAPATDSIGLETMCESRLDETRRWLDRIESIIERYPWPTLLLALAIGYALSRRMR